MSVVGPMVAKAVSCADCGETPEFRRGWSWTPISGNRKGRWVTVCQCGMSPVRGEFFSKIRAIREWNYLQGAPF